MKYLLDLILLAVVTIAIWTVSVPGAAFVFLIAGAFGYQFRKTTLLLGERKTGMKISRQVMAAILALALTAALAIVIHLDVKPAQVVSLEALWSGELFPLFVLLALISSAGACSVISEKRKR
jgi:Ni/Fe-hydrogenase subunit HybB-like protein